METMIERCAKAIYEKLNAHGCAYLSDYGDDLAEVVVVEGRVDLLDIARAVIEEMRKPTEEMVDATGGGECNKWARGAWALMIDAALKEHEGEKR